ncbi:MAG TPA: hypothetical protein VJT75_08200 [Thermoleophilaceae bacterium]|nr:hypothetical protein [Thermoleophilaceae bacterium]
MATPAHPDDDRPPAAEELERAAEHRREADLRLSMSERLEALHYLCLQASQIRGAARPD